MSVWVYVRVSFCDPSFPPCLPSGDSAFPQAPSLEALEAAFLTHPYALPHHVTGRRSKRAEPL